MDLISKIRKELANWGDVTETAGEPLLDQSADRIEKLETALLQISDHSPGVTHGWAEHVRHIARTALSS